MEMQPLYDRSVHFFENYEKGPRALTVAEENQIGSLKEQISLLESEGASTEKELFNGFKIRMPLGLAPGPAYGAKFLSLYNKLGYGFLTQKTLRDRRWEANPMLHTTYLKPGGSYEEGFIASDVPTEYVANSFGMHSVAPDVWVPELKALKKEINDTPLIISGVVTQPKKREEAISQYLEIGKKSQETGANAYEVNVSCPNEMEGKSNELQDDTEFLVDLMDELVKKLQIPVILKIGHRTDLVKLSDAVGETLSKNGAICGINSISAVIKNPDGSPTFGEKRPKAGTSYLPVAPAAKDSLAQLVKARRESGFSYKIISVGGIARPEDVLERLKMGADAVESGAAAMTYPMLALDTRKYLLEQNLKGNI